MKWLILILSLAVLLPANAAQAQLASPNEVGVSMGHLHLNVPDVEAAKKFWVAMRPLR